jgi:acyl-CoA reductase-like NAD-dependent aldehyde dehydrogenase
MIEAYIQDHQLNAMRIAGRPRGAGRSDDRTITVYNPYTEKILGTVPKATLDEVREAFAIAHGFQPRLTRYARAAVLNRAAVIISQRLDQVAQLISAESGLCIKDALYEAGRVSDVLAFGASEVLKDDGQIFSCDLTPHGKKRRVYTQRSPLLGVITAITPFNHPMNQVAHKVVPSIATNNRMVLKPSEKVPLSAILFADILYEAGLPPEMLSVVTGDPREIADELITNPACRPGHLHRRRGDRQIHRQQGRLPPHGAGAGRQRPDHRDGRRRSRRSFHPGGAGQLQELGPALHGGQAHAGA